MKKHQWNYICEQLGILEDNNKKQMLKSFITDIAQNEARIDELKALMWSIEAKAIEKKALGIDVMGLLELLDYRISSIKKGQL